MNVFYKATGDFDVPPSGDSGAVASKVTLKFQRLELHFVNMTNLSPVPTCLTCQDALTFHRLLAWAFKRQGRRRCSLGFRDVSMFAIRRKNCIFSTTQ